MEINLGIGIAPGKPGCLALRPTLPRIIKRPPLINMNMLTAVNQLLPIWLRWL
ncbi:hypothetical protein Lgor_1845 [Fluoribacter gormanii]|uniref:Uncharacterized protein n=1 Tax=Fluoribacter gormanii TaxID=464 RepID=A0A377GK87_9GAMM|nr:hypothetical protein Lgor_1845 [Fluoribacter gormanii]SIR43660.1 hypothetical protein SAMN05421777_11235 [Fluoribacter gormanii]STO25237.1 Uncharacterised protein [Fluoribacter gormanii]